MHLLGYRIRNSAAYSSSDNADLFKPLHFRGFAERSYKVCDAIALVQGVKHLCCTSCSLNHDCNSSLFAVISGYGNGHSLALLIEPENDELARPGMFCHKRGLDFEKADRLRVVQESLGYDFKHFHYLLFIFF